MTSFLRVTVLCTVVMSPSGNPQAPDSGKVIAIGAFDAIRGDTGAHQTGYALDLWRWNGTLVGFLRVPAGPVGDPPTGLLENVTTGRGTRLSFSAKVPGGWLTSTDREVVNYTFEGVLRPDVIEGVIRRHDVGTDRVAAQEWVSMKRSGVMSETMSDFATFRDWEAFAAGALRRLDPKP